MTVLLLALRLILAAVFLVAGLVKLRDLPGSQQAVRDFGVPAALTVGDLAPPIRLPDLDGTPSGLADFRGNEAVVLFWHPSCGFCQQMLPDLTAWEANRREGSPQLLVVSAGTGEANRERGLRSPVVLDQGFGVGRSFGANGTPMAVLLDAEGRIASELAAGAPAVLGLLGALSQGSEGQNAWHRV